MEKARLPSSPKQLSYLNHRRQLWTQILVPLLVAVLFILAIFILTIMVTFRDNGDVGRWAAISTIWIVLPFMAAGLIALIIFGLFIYGMARLLALIPPYSGQAQKILWRVQGYIQRGADEVIKPIFALEGVAATFKRLFGIKP